MEQGEGRMQALKVAVPMASHAEEVEGGTLATRVAASMARPLVLPEPYSGEKDFAEWADHVENIAAINGWDENAKTRLVESATQA